MENVSGSDLQYAHVQMKYNKKAPPGSKSKGVQKLFQGYTLRHWIRTTPKNKFKDTFWDIESEQIQKTNPRIHSETLNPNSSKNKLTRDVWKDDLDMGETTFQNDCLLRSPPTVSERLFSFKTAFEVFETVVCRWSWCDRFSYLFVYFFPLGLFRCPRSYWAQKAGFTSSLVRKLCVL